MIEFDVDPEDLAAAMELDPAIIDEEDARRFHSGLRAVSMYRLSHRLWLEGRKMEAREVNFEAHRDTGCDIHPGAAIGRRFFVDHATGVVIGETAIIGDDVVVYQGVTLGGVSTSKGKRHPTVGNHVVIGANASVLGNITIGSNVRIGAGSVVLEDVPDDCTVVGVPGRIVRKAGIRCVGDELMHNQLPDPEAESLAKLRREIEALKAEIESLSRNRASVGNGARRPAAAAIACACFFYKESMGGPIRWPCASTTP